VRLVHHPVGVSLLLIALALLVLFAISRATWRPAAPLRLAARRSWGQILSASARMYFDRFGLFVAIGLALLPISLVVTVLQALVLHGSNVFGLQTGSTSGGIVAFIILAVGTALTLLGLGLVQAATARAVAEIDEGRPITAVGAYRMVYPAVRPLTLALTLATMMVSLLASSGFGIPIAIWLAGRWSLLVPAIELEKVSAYAGLRRSGRLVAGRWLKVASLIVAGGAIVLVIGPLLGVGLILLTNIPFWLINVIAGLVYAVTMPFVALTTVYAYADARVREVQAGDRDASRMPAEIELLA
jgi:hypothetical protein